jgi:hypothetical protein
MNGNGSTKVLAASFRLRCFSIQMENVVRVAAIARTQQRQSVQHVQLLQHAVPTHLLSKSHTEFGEAYQKMIASQSSEKTLSQIFHTLHNLSYLLRREKAPQIKSAGLISF